MSSAGACSLSFSTMLRSSSRVTSKSSGRRSSLGGARPRPLLPLLVVVLLGFLMSSENMVAGAVEDDANEDAAGPGGCYDMSIHQCNCNPESCSAELCAAGGMFWTADCPEQCDPEKCPAASFVMVTGGDAVTEDFIPVAPGDGGACYDVTIHKCNCNADTCSADLCATASMIWSADCPDHCNPEECLAATSSSSASTTTLEEEEKTSGSSNDEASGSSNDEADTTATSTDPEVEASSGSSRMRVATATTTTVATIGAAVVAALL